MIAHGRAGGARAEGRRFFAGIVGIVGISVVAATGCGAPTTIAVRSYTNTPEAIRALRAGEVDAVVGDLPAMAYAARESANTLEVAGDRFDVASFGIAVSKEAPQLKGAVASALRNLMSTEAYMNVLRNWALTVGRVDSPSAPAGTPEAASVPELTDGVLKVGMEMAFAPMEFKDEDNQPAGADVELARAIGVELGVEVEFVDMEFDKLLEAVERREVDVAMSAITVTPERGQRVEFVEYMRAGSGVLMARDNRFRFVRPHHLCGHTVGVQAGTVQETSLRAIDCSQNR